MAKEIGMLQDSDAVIDLSTTVSRTNTHVDNIIGELNDARIQIGADAESGDPIMSTLDQRLDSMDTVTTNIINAINHTHNENDPNDLLPDGLTQRITAVGTSIAGENGINAHLTTIDTAIGDANGGLTRDVAALKSAVGDNNSGLTSRVKALEDEKSATVIIPNTRITYNTVSNITTPTLYTNTDKQTILTPIENTDYLL
jgi:hypothetical protein